VISCQVAALEIAQRAPRRAGRRRRPSTSSRRQVDGVIEVTSFQSSRAFLSSHLTRNSPRRALSLSLSLSLSVSPAAVGSRAEHRRRGERCTTLEEQNRVAPLFDRVSGLRIFFVDLSVRKNTGWAISRCSRTDTKNIKLFFCKGRKQ